MTTGHKGKVPMKTSMCRAGREEDKQPGQKGSQRLCGCQDCASEASKFPPCL